ncbi:MAG: Crp/Fnr family transcriptional regulator [Candidatus Eremiobacteraeota bacterium]|nr:Crp/Fnr family transcriptional regulator [Candidatus Eremiobacteraeota bacterium]
MQLQRRGSPVRPLPKKSTAEALRLNAILTGLEGPEVDALVASGELVSLPLRYEIYRPDEPIEHVYFPIDCVLSVVTRMKDGSQIEVGTIGREGISAIPLMLGATTSANECYCQVPGTAVKISVALFESFKSDLKFRQLLDRYVQAYVNMLGQLAACNRLHSVYERCARWLLMTQDRVDSVEIRLTHEYLAMMLGTQRSGVTIAAGTLQNAGFIRYGHGIISIVDRSGLEGAACECYDVAREQFGGFLRSVKGLAATRFAMSTSRPERAADGAVRKRKHA